MLSQQACNDSFFSLARLLPVFTAGLAGFLSVIQEMTNQKLSRELWKLKAGGGGGVVYGANIL